MNIKNLLKNIFGAYKNIIVIVLIGVVCFVVSKQIYFGYASQEEGIKVKKDELARRKEIAARASKIIDEYNSARKEFLYTTVDSFKESVESISQSCNIAIDSLQPVKNDKGAYWEAFVNLGTYSPYKNVLELVRLLEENKVTVEKISCRPVLNPGADKKILTQLVLRAATLKK